MPRTYQDRRPDEKPNDYNSNSLTVFKGRVLRTQEIPARSVLIFKAFLENEQGRQIECTWFKKRSFGRFRFDPFGPMKKDFKLNAEVWVIGRQEDRNNFFGNKITVEEYYPAADPLSALHAGRLTPIYSLTEGLTNKQFRLFMHEALQTEALQTEPEILPPALLAKRKLLGSTQALRGIHFPAGLAELDAAKARLAYEEFLLLAIVALFILVIGLYLSRLVSSWVKKILTKIAFDEKTSKIGINELCVRFGLGKSPTYIIAFVLAWAVIFYAIVLAADFLNLTVIRDLFTRFLEFIPTLFVSVLILFAGLLFGKLMGNIIDNASRANNLKGGFLISRAVNIFIVFFCALIAVENLGFATQLVNNVVVIVLASLGLAFGIGVGLGSKPLVEEFLRDLFKRENK